MKILDATCGQRIIWFDKGNSSTIYIDIRPEVKPTIVADTKHLPFKSNTFDLAILDPPHRPFSPTCYLGKQYGSITKQQILDLIAQGSAEISRVLRRDKLLIFKWGHRRMRLSKTLGMMPSFEPLFGQRVRTTPNSTYWVCLKNRKEV